MKWDVTTKWWCSLFMEFIIWRRAIATTWLPLELLKLFYCCWKRCSLPCCASKGYRVLLVDAGIGKGQSHLIQILLATRDLRFKGDNLIKWLTCILFDQSASPKDVLLIQISGAPCWSEHHGAEAVIYDCQCSPPDESLWQVHRHL